MELVYDGSLFESNFSFALSPSMDRLALYASESFHTGARALTRASTLLVIFFDGDYVNKESHSALVPPQYSNLVQRNRRLPTHDKFSRPVSHSRHLRCIHFARAPAFKLMGEMRLAIQLVGIPAVKLLRWSMLDGANVHEYIPFLQQLSAFPFPCLSIFSEALLELSLCP